MRFILCAVTKPRCPTRALPRCDFCKNAERFLTNIFLQYPDSPDFVPSPYGPPEPVKQGERKFKRQSRPVVVVDDSNRFNMHEDEDATVISVNFVSNHINLVTIFGISRLSIGKKRNQPIV